MKGDIMGIAVQELLANDYFRDFEVIAGRKGINKEIQGITALEAPDGFKWTKGKEMIMSSGFAVMHEPDCIRKAFEEGSIQRTSALMIKLGRYLDKIPEDIVALCNEYELPLILAPFSASWMEIISQANVAVMNRTIRKFQVPDSAGSSVTNQSYKEQKIRKILQAVESEMKFPAFLYDIAEEKSFYSSSNFRRMTDYYGLKESDYWDLQMPHTHHTLCDYINMSRYRLINVENPDGPRVSWVIIPIRIHGIIQAYFTVMEAHSLLDYYDEFAIRIAYLMIQSLYEQITGARDAGYMGFENFIHFALSCSEEEKGKIISQAGLQGISMSTVYDFAVIRLANASAGKLRDDIMKAFSLSKCSRLGKLAIIDSSDMLLLTEVPDKLKRSADEMKQMIGEFMDCLKTLVPDAELRCGVCREGKTLRDIGVCVEKCRKVLKMGGVVIPDEEICDYEMLGPLAWLDIPEEELNILLEKFGRIQKEEKNRDLLHTLRIYLENNMNYSLTSDILYVHINTIRKRIDRVSEMTDIDWNDPVERIKTILLLQFLEANQ